MGGFRHLGDVIRFMLCQRKALISTGWDMGLENAPSA